MNDVADDDVGAVAATSRTCHVLANDGGGGIVLLDQGGPIGAAAEGFEAEGPGAGEEVQGVFAADGRGR